jgi:hypothetical protein
MKRITALAFALALAACGNKKKEEPPAATPPPVPVATADAATPEQGSAEAAAVDVPTDVDFEEQAATDITDKNVEAKVKAIEEELKD